MPSGFSFIGICVLSLSSVGEADVLFLTDSDPRNDPLVGP